MCYCFQAWLTQTADCIAYVQLVVSLGRFPICIIIMPIHNVVYLVGPVRKHIIHDMHM